MWVSPPTEVGRGFPVKCGGAHGPRPTIFGRKNSVGRATQGPPYRILTIENCPAQGAASPTPRTGINLIVRIVRQGSDQQISSSTSAPFQISNFIISGLGPITPPPRSNAYPHGSALRIMRYCLYLPTTSQCLSLWFSTSQPVSVTMTRSSTRTPNLPGRYTPGSMEKIMPGFTVSVLAALTSPFS